MPTELTDPEDKKLVTLARSTRARTRAAEGACVRDLDGRTYAAATVDLPSLSLSAVQVAVAMAVTSGASGLEAVVVLGDGEAVKVDDIDYGRAPRIPTFCRFPLGTANLDDGAQYTVSIDGQVVAEHRADAAAAMVFVPALADPTIEGTE